MSEKQENSGQNVVRAPIVVILGHVDHGKTKILDYIRKTKVAEKEAGGITQHIGAYQIEDRGKPITFLDTPGHEAFSAIRSRGAKVADIAILVVAADESVKPQTKEAIKVLEEAKIPFVVAINKVDKENANVPKVKQELAENNVLIEEWGGKIPCVEVSAKTGQGIEALLDMILLVAEVEELKADPQAVGQGVVIEAHLDSRRGQLATLLVRDGRLKTGDWLVAGAQAAKVKSLDNFLGKPVTEAGPSQPVVVSGWNALPLLGESFSVVDSRESAMMQAQENAKLGQPVLFLNTSGPEKGAGKILPLVIKADVFSSLEAIDQVLKTIKSEEVGYKVVEYGLGNVSDGDIKKAISTGAMLVAFNVNLSEPLRMMAEREKADVAVFQIIYELLEAVKKKMAELLDPEVNRILLGKLKVLALFKKDAKSQIVGGKVTSGKVKRGALVEVFRNGTSLAKGKLAQLQSQKADTEEVAEGSEAGLKVDYFSKSLTPNQYIREGDMLEIYEEEKIVRALA